MTPQQGLDIEAGRALFEKNWLSSPASTQASDGLGPLYNARSCARCHPAAGRGHPLARFDAQARTSTTSGQTTDAALVLRLRAAGDYGRQLQTFAVPGLAREGSVSVRYSDLPVSYPDGTTTILREPHYRLHDLAYGQLPDTAVLSPRLAPSLSGVGLLDAIPRAHIQALADPEDADGDGISGAAGAGRFGWQGEEPSLAAQVAAAMHRDMGLGNPLLPSPQGDCTAAQRACLGAPHGNSPQHDNVEASGVLFDTLLAYVAQLPAPASAAADAAPGGRWFAEAGCSACHRPSQPVAGGIIRPYTDLLLHDMGDGLADRDGGGAPVPTRWRTAPLWGAGDPPPAGRRSYLHDGRARSLEEAVLWHGGEAESARLRFMAMPRVRRRALIDFIFDL